MAKRQMVINYVAGEECRVAVIEDGKLEEFHSERADATSHVGSISSGNQRPERITDGINTALSTDTEALVLNLAPTARENRLNGKDPTPTAARCRRSPAR